MNGSLYKSFLCSHKNISSTINYKICNKKKTIIIKKIVFFYGSMLATLLTKQLLHTTDNYIKSLNKWGIFTVGDFLNFFPKQWEDRSNILESFAFINVKEKNIISVTLVSIENTKTSQGKILTKAVIEDKNGFMSECVWFNRNYLSTQLSRFIGKQIRISWKVKYEYWKLSFVSPEIETTSTQKESDFIPVYSDFNYIPWSWIVSKMQYMKPYLQYIEETLPEQILQKYHFISRREALEKLHFPKNKFEFEEARTRLAYDELFSINYTSISHKIEKQSESKGKSISIPLNSDCVKGILQHLPYDLTNHQKISLFQILKDMEQPYAMQRLLQWDVGTWKTVVAAISIIHTLLQAKNIWISLQACLLAPTEILARQHFEWLEKLFVQYGLNPALLVGSTSKKLKDTIKTQLQSGNIDIMIGTHALLESDVIFSHLWLVIIDEQHRFGVRQREVLEKYIHGSIFPHSLNMTATPIPRTLALTLYWDQDLSIINEYPAGRKSIFTKVVSTEEQRMEVERFVRHQIELGRQIFWISPLVEESEKLDLANAISTYESLQDIFAPFQVWLLHGKMKAKEKDEVMKQFSSNEIQILSSTSVVEVWVNVPNATIMCIEWAERFWLSQLHQFRWRVWRGEHQSYCYLFPSKWNKTDRLKAMEKTNNGFELAEIDLELRWPWEVYGVRQSWVPEFKVANMQDLELISQIREDILDLFNNNIHTNEH